MASTLVVFEARYGTDLVWAWCRVEDDTPGFADATYTTTDGFEFVDVTDEPPRLGRYLFTVAAP